VGDRPGTQQWWRAHRRIVTSQDGEDGVLEHVFERIPDVGRWCVDVGASDGQFLSNTWNLIQNHGWSAVLIEKEKRPFADLLALYSSNPRVTPLQRAAWIEGPDALSALLDRASVPPDFDLLSIDVDGNDYHLWERLDGYEPKVVVVEYNPMIPTDVRFVQPAARRLFQGSSLLSICDLGTSKGYELIAATVCNAIFVRREYFELFPVGDNAPAAMRDNSRYETRIFQLYDGTLKVHGYDRLFWSGLPIDERRLQVVPRPFRRYGGSGRSLAGFVARRYQAWRTRGVEVPAQRSLAAHGHPTGPRGDGGPR